MQGNRHRSDKGSAGQGAGQSVNLLGLSQTGKAASSNLANMLVRVQQPPPIYIDADTGKEVTEEWWPDVQ